MKTTRSTLVASAIATSLLTTMASTGVQADGHDEGGNPSVTIYFTRHAEKKTTTTDTGIAAPNYSLSYDENDDPTATALPGSSDGKNLDEVCTGIEDDCAEELDAFGLVRADLLVDYLDRRGILDDIDAVYSSHKYRTYQTVLPTATARGLDVIQLPDGETELSTGTSASECPTLVAIRNAAPGSTLLVAGHSGTLYDIMGDGNGDKCTGLGLLTDSDPSSDQFPKKSDGKVRDFGDLWKVTIRPNGNVRLNYRINLDVPHLTVMNRAPGINAQD